MLILEIKNLSANISKILAFSLLLSCGSNELGDEREEYFQSVRNLGLTPVYPPREGLQVGDVYLVSRGFQNGIPIADDTVSLYVGFDAQTLQLANDQLETRVALQRSISTSDADSGESQNDFFGQGLQTRAEVYLETLTLASFPSIQFSEQDSFAAVATEALRGIGIGVGQRTNIELSFSDVRVYEVPEFDVDFSVIVRSSICKLYQLDEDECTLEPSSNPSQQPTISNFAPVSWLPGRFEDLVSREESSGRVMSSDRCYYLQVITKTYLTRNISYTYRNADIVSAAVVNAREGTEPGSVTPPVNITFELQEKTTDESGEVVTTLTSNSDLTEFATTLGEAIQSGQRGATVGYESWTARGLTFSETYSRPIVVAYDGPAFELPSGIGQVDRFNCPLTAALDGQIQ